MQRVLILGAKGMLGRAVSEKFFTDSEFEVTAWDIEELDITNNKSVKALLSDIAPEVVINCAAYTDVDKAEQDSESAFAINAEAPKYLAEVSKELDARLIHISTDYVFNGKGKSPYREDDSTEALGTYGRSKLAGEIAVRQSGCRFTIIRTSWLFGAGGKNFVDTIAHLAKKKDQIQVVDDQQGKPTWTYSLAEALSKIAKIEATGIYHFANEGQCTWYEFAKEIVKVLRLPTEIMPVTSDRFPRPAPRPMYSVLECSKVYNTLGFTPISWREALNRHLLS